MKTMISYMTLNAKEARRITEESKYTLTENEFIKTLERIEIEANTGASALYNISLRKENVDRLEKLGYTLTNIPSIIITAGYESKSIESDHWNISW